MPENQLDIEIGNRLTEVIDFVVNGKSRQFALKMKIDPSQLAKIQKGTRGLTVEKAVEISSTYNVNLNWLLRGAGDKLIKEKSGASQQPDHDLLTQLRKEIETMRTSLLRLSDLVPSEQEESSIPEVTYDHSSSGKNRSTGKR